MRYLSLFSLAAVLAASSGVLYAIVGHSATEALASSFDKPVPPKVQARPAPAQSKNETLEELAVTSVFNVTLYESGEETAGATAFLVRSDSGHSYVLTNRHVCDPEVKDATKFLMLKAENDVNYVSNIVKISNKTDLCVTTVPSTLPVQMNPLHLAAANPAAETHVTVFGHPHRQSLTVTSGRVLYVQVIELDMGKLFTPDYKLLAGLASSHIAPGSSGSPIFSDQGEVLGIAFATNDEEGHTLFIPVSEIRGFLNSVEATK